MPILLVKNPVAVRSRKLLKNAIACESSRCSKPGLSDLALRQAQDERVEGRSVAGCGRSRPEAAAAGVRGGGDVLAKAADGQPIDEREAAPHRDLPPRLIDHHEVHELRHAGLGGAAGPLVARDDQIDQHPHRRVFVRREELRLEASRRRSRLRACLRRLVRRLRGLGRRSTPSRRRPARLPESRAPLCVTGSSCACSQSEFSKSKINLNSEI